MFEIFFLSLLPSLIFLHNLHGNFNYFTSPSNINISKIVCYPIYEITIETNKEQCYSDIYCSFNFSNYKILGFLSSQDLVTLKDWSKIVSCDYDDDYDLYNQTSSSVVLFKNANIKANSSNNTSKIGLTKLELLIEANRTFYLLKNIFSESNVENFHLSLFLIVIFAGLFTVLCIIKYLIKIKLLTK